MSDANDVVINTNANAVTLKKGTGDNTLLKLSNTSTSLGNGAFSVGLNTISIGCNADTIDAVPFEQDMEITDGKLTINTIRQSGEGDYCLMYDPTSVPKELTYSRYIPDHFDQIDVSMNGWYDTFYDYDVSLNVHDTSMNFLNNKFTDYDVSLNGLDISVNIIDVSLNIHDVSLNVLDVSLNIIDVSLNMIDSTLYSGSTFAIGAGSSATGTNSFAIGNNATTSTYNNAVAIGAESLATQDNQISFGTGNSSYALLGLINNLTRRTADGSQINVPENQEITVRFQTERSAGLLDYNSSTGNFTNNTGRTLIAMINVSLELEITNGGSGRRMLFLVKNSTRQAVSSAELGATGQDGSSVSMTFEIDDGDTIRASLYYTDADSVNIGDVGSGQTQISIFCL